MTRRRRLLVLASTYPRWKQDTEPGFTHQLAKRLTSDFEVHALSPHARGAATHADLDGVSVHRFRYAPEVFETLVQRGGILENLSRMPWKWVLVPTFLLGQLLSFIILLRKIRPDAIHAHWILPQGLVVFAARKLGIKLPPLLITSHGSDLHRLHGGIQNKLKALVLRSANHVTVPSTPMTKLIENLGVPADRISVAPMGADFLRRKSTDSSIKRSSTELLFVGRLVPTKGVDLLIRAMPLMLEHRLDLSLAIVGTGPEERNLKALAKETGVSDQIEFVGAVAHERLPEYYARAALLVAPYVGQEGLGLVLVEALAYGCPVITSKILSVEDIIEPKYESIMLFPVGDVNTLAKTVLRSIEDPFPIHNATTNLAGKLRLRYDWETVTAEYRDILGNIVTD